MCGRYTLTSQEGLVEDLEAALDPEAPNNEWWKPRFNVAPTQPAPVVTMRDGVRTIEIMRWGLVPFWGSKPGARPPLMINARVESVRTNRVFRDALERKRCLVPADGFFEWLHEGKEKRPIWMHPDPRRFVAFAGLWARARPEIERTGEPPRARPEIERTGEPPRARPEIEHTGKRARMGTHTGELRSFTIITGPPNELARAFHDRMPIVLDRSAWAAWLDPTLDAASAHALLTMPDASGWRADPVSPWVNKADHDDPRCIELAAQPVAIQGSLFK